MRGATYDWKLSVWLLAVIFLPSPRTTFAKSQANNESDDSPIVARSYQAACEQSRATVQKLMAEAQIPGLTIAVNIGGESVWSEAFGIADMTTKAPMSRMTLVEIGSVSKLVTAAALVRLAQDERIDLDAPVSRYVPESSHLDNTITPRLLAGHLGGIRHYNGLSEIMSKQHCHRVEQALDVFIKDPLLHKPGTKYFYSSYGYVLLGAAMERAAGETYESLVTLLVLTPMDLRRTRLNPPPGDGSARCAEYWMGRDKRVQELGETDLSCRLAAGGFVSTSDDLARFAVCHMTTSLLKQESIERLFTPQKLHDGKDTSVGIGWRIGVDSAGRKFVHHGGTGGGRAFLLLYPKEKTSVAICCNLGNAPFAESEALNIVQPFLSPP